MPVYLPPITRRRFLRGALASAALALTPGCLVPGRREKSGPPGGDAGEPWALFSDIHIDANATMTDRETNMTDNLRAAVNDVLAWPTRPSRLLISGDLAHSWGSEGDYAAVARLIEPLRAEGMGAHLALGNHDNRERFWTALKADKTAPADLPDRQADMVATSTANWFILDSLIKTAQTPGLLGPAQRAWLARSLDAHQDKPAIIVIHHHPSAGLLDHLIALEDTEAVLQILRPRQQVKAYFFGHTHRWSVTRDPSGIHFVNLPPTAYVFDRGQPNGWVFAMARSDGMRLELRCLDHSHRDHGQVVNLPWRLASV